MSTAIYDAKMTLENSGFIAAMNKARESTSKALETIRTVGLGITGLGGAFAAFKGAEAITEGLKGAIEQGRQFAVQARQASQSVAVMVELKRAFMEAGISGDGVSTTLFMLNKALGGVNEEGIPTASAFQRIGLSIADLKKQNAVEQFQSIISGLNKLPDASARANAAQQIFGRGALDIMAVLNDPKGFSESIKGSMEYARTLQQNAGAFERVGKAVEQIQMKVEEFYSGVAAGLAPILEKVLALVNKIDFGKFGTQLGSSIATAFEAFKDGKIFDIFKLGLTLAFKEAVNVMYGGIFGLAGAMQAVFAHVPKLLQDAFSMLTNSEFWKGIGELLLGAFISIQGRLILLFIAVADALGNRLADILDHVPFLKETVEALRANLNRGSDAAAQAVGRGTAKGDAMTSQGASRVARASSPLVRDYLQTLSDEVKSFIGAFKANKAFDTTGEIGKLQGIFAGLSAKVASEAPADEKKKDQAPGQAAAGNYKLPDSDRLAKLGLFIGAAVQTPGLTEARRTAAATEGSLKRLNGIYERLGASSQPQGMGYGLIPRYL